MYQYKEQEIEEWEQYGGPVREPVMRVIVDTRSDRDVEVDLDEDEISCEEDFDEWFFDDDEDDDRLDEKDWHRWLAEYYPAGSEERAILRG